MVRREILAALKANKKGAKSLKLEKPCPPILASMHFTSTSSYLYKFFWTDSIFWPSWAIAHQIWFTCTLSSFCMQILHAKCIWDASIWPLQDIVSFVCTLFNLRQEMHNQQRMLSSLLNWQKLILRCKNWMDTLLLYATAHYWVYVWTNGYDIDITE